MNTIQTYNPVQIQVERKASLVTKFLGWCKAQEENRFLWLAIIIAGHACVITPLTLLFVMLGGNHMFFWGLTIGAMAFSLVSNLAAMPTKITIPVFFAGLLIDLYVIISCIYLAFAA